MRKSLISFLLLIILPTFVWAVPDAGIDRCRSPKDFTIDKRCYIRSFEQKIKPYNATVALVRSSGGRPYCTGTIIKQYDGKLYLYTANHCVDDRGAIKNTINIRTQDGKYFSVSIHKAGADSGYPYINDFAIYAVPDEYQNIKWTSISNAIANTVDYEGQGVLLDDGNLYKAAMRKDTKFKFDYEAEVVGYGALKIMSDAEIEAFKQKYIDYLKKEKGITSDGWEWAYCWRGGGVNVSCELGVNFLDYLRDKEKSYYIDLFEDSMLKRSDCIYTSTGERLGCQVWGGNSGGGVFDAAGNLMGILNSGFDYIGGWWHAESTGLGDVDFLSWDKKVSIQKDEK